MKAKSNVTEPGATVKKAAERIQGILTETENEIAARMDAKKAALNSSGAKIENLMTAVLDAETEQKEAEKARDAGGFLEAGEKLKAARRFLEIEKTELEKKDRGAVFTKAEYVERMEAIHEAAEIFKDEVRFSFRTLAAEIQELEKVLLDTELVCDTAVGSFQDAANVKRNGMRIENGLPGKPYFGDITTALREILLKIEYFNL